jgi:hypothetical protein
MVAATKIYAGTASGACPLLLGIFPPRFLLPLGRPRGRFALVAGAPSGMISSTVRLLCCSPPRRRSCRYLSSSLADCGPFIRSRRSPGRADVLLRLLFQRSLQARKGRLSELYTKRINVTFRRRILSVGDLLYTCTKLGAPGTAAGLAIQPCWAIRPRGRRENILVIELCFHHVGLPTRESLEIRLPNRTDWRVVSERRRRLIPCHDLRSPDK